MKTCSKCGVEKPLTDFYKDRANATGLHAHCATCQNAAARDYALKNPRQRDISAKKTWLKRAYGMTYEDRQAMLAAQGNCCAICGDPFLNSKHTHVDHIHASNPVRIRGILCNTCNMGLGYFKDSSERLAKAVAYLLKNKT